MRGDRGSLVALDGPQEVPYQRKMTEPRDFFHGLLREILAKRLLACGIGLLDGPGRKGLADSHQLYGAGVPTSGARGALDARPEGLPPLNVCIQVNVSGEATKSGVGSEDAARLADAVARLPRLRLRGLMAIPEPTSDTAFQRQRFALLRELKDQLAARGHALDTLSMGMSDDLEAAIAEGATIVRVGTAIFGSRKK